MENRDKNNALCLYGIIPRPESHDMFSLAENLQVVTIPYKNIAAVVAENVRIDRQRMDKEQIAKSLLDYHKVVEGVMNMGINIIPASFGTYAGGSRAIVRMLDKGYRLITKVMNKIADRMEIDIAAKWSDFNRILAEITDDEELVALKKDICKNQDNISYADQVNVGHLLRKLLDRKKEKYKGEILPALTFLSYNIRHYDALNDEIVFNVALLVDLDQLLLIEKEIERLDKEFNGQLNFKLVGPLPCYSFYTLEMRALPREEIQMARHELGLTDDTSLKSLKKAYFGKIRHFHPDSNPGNHSMEGFNRITRAYHTLADYLNAVDPAADNENFVMPSEEEDAFYLKVKDQKQI